MTPRGRNREVLIFVDRTIPFLLSHPIRPWAAASRAEEGAANAQREIVSPVLLPFAPPRLSVASAMNAYPSSGQGSKPIQGHTRQAGEGRIQGEGTRLSGEGNPL